MKCFYVVFCNYCMPSAEKPVSEFCDEDGVRFSTEDSRRRFPGGIVGSLHFGWKSRNNHFISYNDLVTKGEQHIYLCNCDITFLLSVI